MPVRKDIVTWGVKEHRRFASVDIQDTEAPVAVVIVLAGRIEGDEFIVR